MEEWKIGIMEGWDGNFSLFHHSTIPDVLRFFHSLNLNLFQFLIHHSKFSIPFILSSSLRVCFYLLN